MQKWIIMLCMGTTLAIYSVVGDASASASATKNGTSVKAPIRVDRAQKFTNFSLSFTGEKSGKLIFTFKQDEKKEEQIFSYPLLA